MMQMMLDLQKEETRRLLRENVRELATPIVQCELGEVQSEEGNYSRIGSQDEPRVVRKTIRTEGLIRVGVSIRTSWMPNHQIFLEAQNQ